MASGYPQDQKYCAAVTYRSGTNVGQLLLARVQRCLELGQGISRVQLLQEVGLDAFVVGFRHNQKEK